MNGPTPEENARLLLDALEAEGYDWFAGVPCSLLTSAIRLLESDARHRYVSAVREDAAVGSAVGAWLGGRKPAVFMQNSGFTVCYNALAALSLLYRVPTLLVVSWRGHGPDAPEHILTGETIERVFETLGIPYRVLQADRIREQVAEVTEIADRDRIPAALLVRKGIFS